MGSTTEYKKSPTKGGGKGGEGGGGGGTKRGCHQNIVGERREQEEARRVTVKSTLEGGWGKKCESEEAEGGN